MGKCVIACDDGVVNKLGGGFTVVACVLYGSEHGLTGVGHLPIKVDGLDASSQVAYIARRMTGQCPSGAVEAVFFDSITIGGFNIISPPTIAAASGAPVVFIYKRAPNLSKIADAVIHTRYSWIRMRVLTLLSTVREVNTLKGPLYVVTWGLLPEEARSLIEKYQVHARMPEPLRIAHYIASSISRVIF
ncbi:MAG: DUF99 family protein [Desulfurococcales archaeon]|nr:DUF99 family protein [Desulfurococcales archaeon]